MLNHDISSLRIIGFFIGIIGLSLTFILYRIPKWKKSNFLLFSIFNISLIIIAIYPATVNVVRDVLSMENLQQGRLTALLIISNIYLFFFSFYKSVRLENYRLQFDQLVRKLGVEDFEKQPNIAVRIKPIMVLIPAYNEADNLRTLLPKIPNKIEGIAVGILVIDDGSIDTTDKVVRHCGHLIVANRINRGQGAASRLGYDVLTKHNILVAVTMDADNQHRPEDIEKLVVPILKDESDLVIGSRILGEYEKDNWLRNMGIIVFSWIISLIIDMRVTDCSSGFKAFRIKSIGDLILTEDQFQSAEVLIEAMKKGLRIKEVPIEINKRKYGSSKKGKDWSYGLNFARAIFKSWWK